MIKKYIVETLDGVTQYVQTLGASDDGVFHSVMTCVNELQDAESAIEEAYNRGKADERERIIALFSKPLDDHKAFSWEEIGIFAKVARNLEKQNKPDEIKAGDEVQYKSAISKGIVYEVNCGVLKGKLSNVAHFIPFEWPESDCKKTGRRFNVKETLMHE